MNPKKPVQPILYVALIFFLLAPRLRDLVKFTAADEPFWLAVGANYYYALTHREFENTVYEYHPAVTTMWIGTAAMLIYFPEYRGLMDGYFVEEKSSFDEYLVAHGKNPLQLLWWCRFLQLLVNIFLFMVAFHLLRVMLGGWPALAALLIATSSPYLFGQSRMLNHESMVGLFSLISVLGMAAYLFHERRPVFLVLSAGAAAFSNLTKSSSIVLLPVVGAMLLVWLIRSWNEKRWRLIGSALAIFMLWLGILLLVYVVFWPGMWVAPGKMLYEVYGNAFSYAFQGARLSVTEELVPSSFGLDLPLSGITNFLISMAWRTTPVTWLGLLLSLLLLLGKDREAATPIQKYLVAFLFLEAFACIAMFGIIRGRNSPHYILASHYALEFAAAMGWVFFLRWLAGIFLWARRPVVQTALFLVIFAAQIAGLFQTHPYYYTYLNPILRARLPVPEFLYGERMEEAAAYLAAKPGAGDMTALVYFGRSFSYYFPGTTVVFKPVMFEDKPLLVEYLQGTDYLVLYSSVSGRLPWLRELTPEKIIDLNGRPYVEIYRVEDIPPGLITD